MIKCYIARTTLKTLSTRSTESRGKYGHYTNNVLYTGYATIIVAGWLAIAILVYYAAEWTYKALTHLKGIRLVYKAIKTYEKDKYHFNEAELELLEKRQIELLDKQQKTDDWLIEQYKQEGFPKNRNTLSVACLRPIVYEVDNVTKIVTVQSNGLPRWVVRKQDLCLDKQSQWIPESNPSNKENHFIENTLFARVQEALDAYNGIQDE